LHRRTLGEIMTGEEYLPALPAARKLAAPWALHRGSHARCREKVAIAPGRSGQYAPYATQTLKKES
jgi:hypothetical protein